MQVRVQKAIADSGLCSRRAAEDLIKSGQVTVNGKRCLIGMSCDPEKDVVCVDGEEIRKEKFVYIMLNKPQRYISTTLEERGKRPVTDLVDVPERVFPVGRLDYDTEGLLLLTNDGYFAQQIAHPRHGVSKTYEVQTQRSLSDRDLERLHKGVRIDGRNVDIEKLAVVGKKCVQVTIHEGRKHIVKKVFSALRHHIVLLKRVAVGSVKLGGLKQGTWRFLREEELRALRSKVFGRRRKAVVGEKEAHAMNRREAVSRQKVFSERVLRKKGNEWSKDRK